MKLRQYYIYIYRDPSTNVPRYVGKGFGRRAYLHMIPERCLNKQLRSWIQQLIGKKLTPIIEVISMIDEEIALFNEVNLISIFGRIDINPVKGTLFNHTDGGEGSSGFITSEETKKKQSKTHKLLYENGHQPSSSCFEKGYTPWNKGILCPEHSERMKGSVPWNKGLTGIPSTRKNYTHSEETRTKMSEAKKQYHKNRRESNNASF